jgi:AcrR family transcriptional regulator
MFAENGYARTTTRALATAAGVTEITLFRHFGSKENLFAAVVQDYGTQVVASILEAELTGDYRADLLHIGQLFLSMVVERREIIRLMMCEATHFPELAQMLSQNPLLLRQTLVGYFQQQIDAGRLRPLNTEAAAQAFLGMFFAYGLILSAFDEQLAVRMPLDEVVPHFVDIFINGTVHEE